MQRPSERARHLSTSHGGVIPQQDDQEPSHHNPISKTDRTQWPVQKKLEDLEGPGSFHVISRHIRYRNPTVSVIALIRDAIEVPGSAMPLSAIVHPTSNHSALMMGINGRPYPNVVTLSPEKGWDCFPSNNLILFLRPDFHHPPTCTKQESRWISLPSIESSPGANYITKVQLSLSRNVILGLSMMSANNGVCRQSRNKNRHGSRTPLPTGQPPRHHEHLHSA